MLTRAIRPLTLLCGAFIAWNAFAGAATHFTLTAPSTATAGTAFTFLVQALDASNNVATGYTGTVHFTSTDGAAVLPANATLTNGSLLFSATLKTAGNQKLTATDTVTSSITGSTNNINVLPGAATHFTVSAPASAAAGNAFSFTVTALDQGNNVATGYAGTVNFTSPFTTATLPGPSTLTNGSGTFAATLVNAGAQTITAKDAANNTITGISNSISVSPGAVTLLEVITPDSAVPAGFLSSFVVYARDNFSNTATSYSGTVHFTSSDPNVVLPADTTLTSGIAVLNNTFKTAGIQSITATDIANSALAGTSKGVVVTPAAATHFLIDAAPSAAIGFAFNFTVIAQDQFNNTATGYTGTVHFTTNDNAAVKPADSTLVNGTRSFPIFFGTLGNHSIIATDTANATITGSTAVNVLPPQPPSFDDPSTLAFRVGVAGSFTFSPSGLPVPTLSGAGPLPAGLTFDASTATLSGTPSAGSGGQYQFTLTAANGVVPGAIQTVLIFVFEPPSLFSLVVTPQVAGVGQNISFSSAAFGGPGPLTYTWTFGDGSSGIGANVTHSYAAAGVFNFSLAVTDKFGNSAGGNGQVTVNPVVVGVGPDSDGDGFSDTVESAANTDPNSSASTPTGQPITPAAVGALTVSKALIKLNFAKPNADAIAFSGTLNVPAGFTPAGSKVNVDVSGVAASFTLDKKGSAKNTGASVKISIKSKGGAVAQQTSKYSVSLSKGAFAAPLAASGLTNADAKDAPVNVLFSVVFNGAVLQKSQALVYNAKKDKSSVAKN